VSGLICFDLRYSGPGRGRRPRVVRKHVGTNAIRGRPRRRTSRAAPRPRRPTTASEAKAYRRRSSLVPLSVTRPLEGTAGSRASRFRVRACHGTRRSAIGKPVRGKEQGNASGYERQPRVTVDTSTSCHCSSRPHQHRSGGRPCSRSRSESSRRRVVPHARASREITVFRWPRPMVSWRTTPPVKFGRFDQPRRGPAARDRCRRRRFAPDSSGGSIAVCVRGCMRFPDE
jgi:hypothetical protein